MSFYRVFTLLYFTWVIHAATVIKRDPSRHYYTLHFPQPDESTPHHAQVIAQALDTRYEGRVGELMTYYLVSSPLSTKRSLDTSDRVLASFEQQKKNTDSKVDKRLVHPWSMVQRIDKQVLRRRSRRAVIPSSEGKLALEAAQSSLGIHDPGFIKQWHLVNHSQTRKSGADLYRYWGE